MSLRDYQSRDVDRIGEALQLHRSVLYTLPTGGGKTVEFAAIGALCHEAGTRVVILVHRDNLLDQAAAKLRDTGTPYSVIAPGRTDFGDSINIASVNTLVRRLHRYSPFDLIIVDEAHHAISPSYRKILDNWPESRILGVTATPCRLDGRGLGEVFSSLLIGPSIRELIDAGYLTDSITYASKQLVDLSQTRTTAGDYNLHDLQEAMDRNEITGDAVSQYTRLCRGVPAIAFCVSVQHAQDVSATFRASGYRAASIDGRMPLSTIRARLDELRRGELHVLASCELISEGFDAPGVVAAILLRPTKSLAVYLQQVGRTLRPIYADGLPLDTVEQRLWAIGASVKPRAIILDHAGNCFRFGLPDEEREWSLDAKKKKPSTNNIKQCPQCFAVSRPWATRCGSCGYIFPIAVRDGGGRNPNSVDGELKAVDPVALRAVRRAEERGARSYADLVELGRKRGYQNPMKWAYMRWIARGGDPEEARMYERR